MEFQNGEELKESATRNDESKIESERSYFSESKDSNDAEFKNGHSHINDGPTAPKPNDVRNGDLVSLLLAATPPYLYNIPLVPQTFFFSEMLKSFVQAKTERQNTRAQQSHNRRQRKRTWKETTPPNTLPYEIKDKPLELTIPKQLDDKQKAVDKGGVKKYQLDMSEKKYQSSKLGSSDFSVEKLANSSITSGSEVLNGSSSGELVPPTPPMWYPFLYPPHPPYGIDPLHFFIDLRVSAHFWNRNVSGHVINNEQLNSIRPSCNSNESGRSTPNPVVPIGTTRRNSAFAPPPPRCGPPPLKEQTCKRNSQSVHYVVSGLKRIYDALQKNPKEMADEGPEKSSREKLGHKDAKKDLRALIGLELVVDYFKRETNTKNDESVPGNQERHAEI